MGLVALVAEPDIPKPLSPEASLALTEVPDGFELLLFASEPDIGKPIAMEWDERGRLWIIETVEYPNEKTGEPVDGDDRILICEDTDGDGKADKFTVFADGLDIPTAFTFVAGGVLVAQAPHFLLLRDLDGDDIADTREVVLSGWGTFDTHAGPSNLQYGLDNKLWGTVGYSGFDGTIGGIPHQFGQGAYRFNPAVGDGVTGFEYLAATSNNTWGLGFTEEFDAFLSCTNNEHSIHLAIPAAYYTRAYLNGQGIGPIDNHYAIHPLVDGLNQQDVPGGFTAATGHSFYTARAFPPEYWNRVAFICEPTGRLIHRHVIEPRGSGFAEVGDGRNILASRDPWFTPVAARVGPDGALWVLDWYNYMVHHVPEQASGEDQQQRDLFRGRVYRLVYGGNAPNPVTTVSADDPGTLLKALRDDNLFWRTTAQRLIVERGYRQLAPALRRLIAERTMDSIRTNAAALHALWTLKGLGLLDGQDAQSLAAVIGALHHPAAGVRRAAVQALPVAIPAVIDQLIDAGVCDDPDHRVRVAAYLALAQAKPSPRAMALVAATYAANRPVGDNWLDHALQIAHRVHDPMIRAVTGDSVRAEPAIDQAVDIRAVLGQLAYDRPHFSVRAGTSVKLTFRNPNYMQHNLVIVKPDALERVHTAAVLLAQEPGAASRQYIPEGGDVLYATPLVNPNTHCDLRFTAPSSPGLYPFLCTFPGHSAVMRGVMEVTD